MAGVLLDMDGTLLDTEVIYLSSTMAAMNSLGYPDAMEICHAMIGIPGPECEAMLLSRYGPQFSISGFNREFVIHRDRLLEQGLPLKPGASELIDALADAQIPRAVVTSSSRKTAERHLTLAGIRSRIEMVVTRDDVSRGKPAPDLYLLAAERLSLAPQSCLAIEDSTPGISAAHAAGIAAIMVPDILQPTADTRQMCAAVLPDLMAVLALLRTQGFLPGRVLQAD
ncbi:HAD family hydrolase [Devosia nitrariae]|uniref:Haloacid dehalogenase n=1 Tax=Devosia nitrariae TaxID=2071872 RepID=A0ABQ5W1M9_9HYPH|nr:HAD family phosphatase [Devosia nitrariae]GLQ53781.1 haloacid dehalogenase [Devosia nitrariae]